MLKKFLVFIYWNILYKSLKLFPIQEKVFFESFLGRSYSDSPKAMYEYMRDNNYNYKYVWSMRNPSDLRDSKCLSIKKMSFTYLYHLATAKYIVNNSRMPGGYSKRKNQKYVQTWHGTPLKKLVFDMENVTLPNMDKEKYFKTFKKDIDDWDYLISPNEFSTDKFKSAFRFEKKIVEYGYPRNQELIDVDPSKIIELKRKLNIPFENKIILYAPTFRDNNYKKTGHYIQDINIDFEKLDMSKTTFLLRNHYLIRQINYKYGKNANIVDVTDYSNINDLFIVSDILITDYSSVFFDYMLLKKPIIFYQYDQREYANEIRGFYLPIEDLPGKLVVEEKDIYDVINQTFDYDYDKFNMKYHMHNDEKEITRKVVEEIFQ